MAMYCFTCDADQPHRPLTRAEEAWLKERLGRASVHEFRMCEAELNAGPRKQCRNLRTGMNKKPFAQSIRVPVLD